jgi:hypothetical protein
MVIFARKIFFSQIYNFNSNIYYIQNKKKIDYMEGFNLDIKGLADLLNGPRNDESDDDEDKV